MNRTLSCLILLFACLSSAPASEKLKGIACRSVHLGYRAPEAKAVMNTIVVKESHPGTYFAVCGFAKGYFGIQELYNGNKVVIFSVWDPAGQQDPRKVDPEDRVKILYKDDDVRIGRFGNEGTGGQSFYNLDWQYDQPVHFKVEAQPDNNHTIFTGYLRLKESEPWKKLVSMRTVTGGISLRGVHSFVEDFRRNRVSATQTRKAQFGPVKYLDKSGEWQLVAKARFTGDGNPVMNIDAGTEEGRFFLATGGEITNDHTPLWKDVIWPGKSYKK